MAGHQSFVRRRRRISALVIAAALAPTLSARAMTGAPWQSATAVQKYTTAVLADSPLSFWQLQDPSKSKVAAEQTSNHLNGVYAGPIKNVYDGPMLGASGIRLSDDTTMTSPNDVRYGELAGTVQNPSTFTIELWLRSYRRDPGRDAGVLQLGLGRMSIYIVSMDIQFDESRRLVSEFSDGTTYVITPFDGGGVASDGAWHQVAESFVGSTDGDIVNLYLDGSPVATAAVPQPFVEQAAPLIVGSSPCVEHQAIDVSDLSVYQSALTGQQVQAHFDASGVASAKRLNPDGPTEQVPTSDETGGPAAYFRGQAGDGFGLVYTPHFPANVGATGGTVVLRDPTGAVISSQRFGISGTKWWVLPYLDAPGKYQVYVTSQTPGINSYVDMALRRQCVSGEGNPMYLVGHDASPKVAEPFTEKNPTDAPKDVTITVTQSTSFKATLATKADVRTEDVISTADVQVSVEISAEETTTTSQQTTIHLAPHTSQKVDYDLFRTQLTGYEQGCSPWNPLANFDQLVSTQR